MHMQKQYRWKWTDKARQNCRTIQKADSRLKARLRNRTPAAQTEESAAMHPPDTTRIIGVY